MSNIRERMGSIVLTPQDYTIVHDKTLALSSSGIIKFLNLLKEELNGLTVIGDEEIYKLNECDTDQRRHIFWEGGVLDTCKAMVQAQLSHTKEELKERLK